MQKLELKDHDVAQNDLRQKMGLKYLLSHSLSRSLKAYVLECILVKIIKCGLSSLCRE